MPESRNPTDAELDVLVALKEHHYLTVDQVMLVTSRSSLRGTQQRLRDLADAGFVQKHDRRSSNVLEPLRAAWSLTGKSKRYLEDAEMVVLPPRRPRPYTLDHVLMLNNVLVRAKALVRQHPTVIELLELHHDRDLRTWKPGLSVVPDGFLHFSVNTQEGRFSFPILLEVDMGTMDRRRWQEKVARYIAFLGPELTRVFDTDVATVAVVVGTDEKRVRDLKRWTEGELSRQDAKDAGEVFYFTQLTSGLPAEDLFLSKRFRVAFTTAAEALLPANLSPKVD